MDSCKKPWASNFQRFGEGKYPSEIWPTNGPTFHERDPRRKKTEYLISLSQWTLKKKMKFIFPTKYVIRNPQKFKV